MSNSLKDNHKTNAADAIWRVYVTIVTYDIIAAPGRADSNVEND
jgi:hypothetical protein